MLSFGQYNYYRPQFMILLFIFFKKILLNHNCPTCARIAPLLNWPTLPYYRCIFVLPYGLQSVSLSYILWSKLRPSETVCIGHHLTTPKTEEEALEMEWLVSICFFYH